MEDQSYLDLKYFIDDTIYNCPFCNRRHVSYQNLGYDAFHWTREKVCYIWRVIPISLSIATNKSTDKAP